MIAENLELESFVDLAPAENVDGGQAQVLGLSKRFTVKRKCILYVDTNSELGTLFGERTMRERYRVIHVADPSALAHLLDTVEVDLVITGTGLDDESIHQMCLSLQQFSENKIPVIARIDRNNEENINRLMRYGINEFIYADDPAVLVDLRLKKLLDHEPDHNDLDRTIEQMEKFISPGTRSMIQQVVSDGVVPLPVEKDVCIVFTDLRDFTQLSEILPPDELFYKISQHLGAQVDVIRKHGG